MRAIYANWYVPSLGTVYRRRKTVYARSKGTVSKRIETYQNKRMEEVDRMKVQIEGNLYLESDGLEFTIKKYGNPYTNNKGELIEPSTTSGHFSNVHSAIKYLVKMKIMESTATDLKGLLESVEGIREYIEERVRV
jgi:hypothetical protein